MNAYREIIYLNYTSLPTGEWYLPTGPDRVLINQ